jgi:hypothetical protein
MDLSDVQAYLQQKQQLMTNPGASAAMSQPPPPSPVESTAPNLSDVQRYLAQKQQTLSTAPIPQATPGALESLARGAEQGATLDFAPRLNAAIQSTFGSTDYDTALKNEQAAMEKAQAAHPYLYGAGNIAGTVAPLAIPGVGEAIAGEGILGAAKTGAALGGISGIGKSQDLTDLGGTAQSALTGAVQGGLTGGAVGAASDVLSPFLNQIKGLGSDAMSAVGSISPLRKFAKGYASGRVAGLSTGEEAGTQAIQEASNAVDDVTQKYDELLNSAQKQAENLRLNGDVIDHSDWFNSALNAINSAKQFIPESDATGQAALDKLNNLISGYGEAWGDQLTPTQAVFLKRKLGQLGSEGDTQLGDDYARQLANRLISPLRGRGMNEVESTFDLPPGFVPLKNVITDGIEGLPENVQTVHKMLNARDDMPDLTTLLNAQKGGRAGVDATNKINDFYNALPDEVVDTIKPVLDAAGQKAGIAEAINASTLGSGILGTGIGKGAVYGAGNVVGAATRDIASRANQATTEAASGNIGSLFKTMYNQSPETFNAVGNQLVGLGGTASDIGKALIGATQKDNFGRNAIIFALSQNPAYRSTIEQHFGNAMSIQPNPPAGQASQLARGNF